MKDKVEIKVVGGVNEDFTGCDDCKYTRLPISACRVMGCIHSWNSMKDFYEKDRGHWISRPYYKDDDIYYKRECCNCGHVQDMISSYCPNCGSEMTELNRVKTELKLN